MSKEQTSQAPSPAITFYGAHWCPDSRRSRRLLDGLGVPYDFVDLDQDEVASAFVREHARGHRTTPTILLGHGGPVLVEPSDEDLVAALRDRGFVAAA